MWERSKKIENMDGKVIIFPLNFKAMPGTLDWGRVKIKGNKAIVSPKTRTRTNSTIWDQLKRLCVDSPVAKLSYLDVVKIRNIHIRKISYVSEINF